MPKVSIIIVNLNGKQLLEKLLPSLASVDTCGYDVETLVVDNGSDDGSRELLKEEFPSVKIHPLASNFGFAPAVNIGTEFSDGEYIVLLNNDCILRENWLRELLSTFEQDDSIACVGSLILDSTGGMVDFHHGGANIFGWGFQMGQGMPYRETSEEPFRTFFACGAACAFRRDAFVKAGRLLEETFAYFEDVEIGWRLNALGYEVWINPASIIEHHHGATVKSFGKGFHGFLTERNALLNAWCNLSVDEGNAILPIAMALGTLRIAARSGSSLESAIGMRGMEGILSARGEDISRYSTQRELKDAIKKLGSLVGSTEAAHAEAIADFGRLMPVVRKRRDELEQNRNVSTSELLDLMGDPFRPVIGHPRENAFIEQLEPFLREVIG
jgi:GT2 family glycosyltransferase